MHIDAVEDAFSWERSAEVKGKLVEMAPVFILRRIWSWSALRMVLFKPCSCWLLATLEKTIC